MATFRPILFSLFLPGLIRVADAQTNTSPANPVPHPAAAIEVQRDVVFGKGGTHDLHADIAHPRGLTAAVPAIIYIHGGGWIGGSYKDSESVERLAKAGFFTASIEYRLDDVAKWPAQVEDCKLAVRWVRANAAAFHVDPKRIGVFGDSAGGHLVTCLATMANVKAYDEGDSGYPGVSSTVQAVVDFFGPTDFMQPGIYSPEAIQLTEGLMGTTRDQNPELWKSASPVLSVAPGDPPVLMVHGDSDTLVPLAQSQVFADALDKAGVPHQLIVVKNAGHGFAPLPGKQIDPGWPKIQQDTLDFFVKYLGDPHVPLKAP